MAETGDDSRTAGAAQNPASSQQCSPPGRDVPAAIEGRLHAASATAHLRCRFDRGVHLPVERANRDLERLVKFVQVPAQPLLGVAGLTGLDAGGGVEGEFDGPRQRQPAAGCPGRC
jgi:hypothetical protein